jgi:GMP synthase-like glutamine amidotransferase
MMKNVIYLPVNITVPKKEMDIMIQRMLGICYRYQLLAEYKSKQ